jgi:hypothetical protein
MEINMLEAGLREYVEKDTGLFVIYETYSNFLYTGNL